METTNEVLTPEVTEEIAEAVTTGTSKKTGVIVLAVAGIAAACYGTYRLVKKIRSKGSEVLDDVDGDAVEVESETEDK